MIKRVLGVICTLLIIATIIFASLEWGNYRSMVFKRQNRVEPVREQVVVEVEEQSEQVDSMRQTQRPKKKANPNAQKKSNPNAKKRVSPEAKKKTKRVAGSDEQQPRPKAKKRVEQEQN